MTTVRYYLRFGLGLAAIGYFCWRILTLHIARDDARRDLAQCRAAGSITVTAQAAAGWDDALKVAERCVADLDYCRSLCARESVDRSGTK